MPKSQGPSIDALAAAALFVQGKTQVQIAATLSLSQSAISRLLKSEQVRKQILIERRFNWDAFPADVQHQVRRKMSKSEIGDRITRLAWDHKQSAPTVHVVPVGESPEIPRKFETFAAHAAVVLRDLLEEVRGQVGVAWGSTLWHTTQALRSILPQHPFRQRLPIEFVPLCGDPLIDSQENYADRTSSRIVSELSKAVNGDEPRPAWLGLVPAFIPRTFKKSEIQVIDRLIDLTPRYASIFGPRIKPAHPLPEPIAGNLHMIITAAGPSKRPLGFGRNALLGLTDEQSGQLAENIYGDIGGVLLPRLADNPARKGQEPVPHHLVAELTRNWTGLKIEHLKTCSDRAFSENSKSRPGVTLLSFGATHVEIVLEAVRRGLVNQLIIGSDLEEAIAEAIPRGVAEGSLGSQ